MSFADDIRNEIIEGKKEEVHKMILNELNIQDIEKKTCVNISSRRISSCTQQGGILFNCLHVSQKPCYSLTEDDEVLCIKKERDGTFKYKRHLYKKCTHYENSRNYRTW